MTPSLPPSDRTLFVARPAAGAISQLAERRFGRAFIRGPSKSNIVRSSRIGPVSVVSELVDLVLTIGVSRLFLAISPDMVELAVPGCTEEVSTESSGVRVRRWRASSMDLSILFRIERSGWVFSLELLLVMANPRIRAPRGIGRRDGGHRALFRFSGPFPRRKGVQVLQTEQIALDSPGWHPQGVG